MKKEENHKKMTISSKIRDKEQAISTGNEKVIESETNHDFNYDYKQKAIYFNRE